MPWSAPSLDLPAFVCFLIPLVYTLFPRFFLSSFLCIDSRRPRAVAGSNLSLVGSGTFSRFCNQSDRVCDQFVVFGSSGENESESVRERIVCRDCWSCGVRWWPGASVRRQQAGPSGLGQTGASSQQSMLSSTPQLFGHSMHRHAERGVYQPYFSQELPSSAPASFSNFFLYKW